MSSNKNKTSKENDSDSGTSNVVVGGIAAVVGVAVGAGLAHFFGGSNAGPQCNAGNSRNGSGGNRSSTSSSTYRNREPLTCEVCTICLDPVGGISVLPCSHRFHTSCLKPWLNEQETCPTCRQPAPKNSIRHF